MKTGGGSSTLEMTSEQEILLATIREQVEPLDNAYDSAAEYFNDIEIFEKPQTPIPELALSGRSTDLARYEPSSNFPCSANPEPCPKPVPTLPRRKILKPRKKQKLNYKDLYYQEKIKTE
ncbi:uncharacterized protein LOC123004081, partial [Tribolium madens]|uniref:uncharacterized protein LOC123004081 n=1 Tax=Tribolium madens TaxID=41895 RepID=UPI001CF7496E